MFNFQAAQLVHLHGDKPYPMTERPHLDSADQDPERGWVQGAKIFRCTRCEEEVLVVPPGDERRGAEPA